MVIMVSRAIEEFFNHCHGEDDGKFCDTAGGNKKGRTAAERAAAAKASPHAEAKSEKAHGASKSAPAPKAKPRKSAAKPMVKAPVKVAAKKPEPKKPEPKEEKPVDDYHGAHRPNETGPRAHDMIESEVVPSDVYDRPELYTGYSGKELKETMAQLRAARGNPDAMVTIYRAAPKVANAFRSGDWVTLSPTYAQTHADSQGSGLVVHSQKVKASTIRWAIDDMMEYGYYPDTMGTKYDVEGKPIEAKPMEDKAQYDGPEVYRGANVKLTKEQNAKLVELLKSPMNGDQFNQHFKVGEMLAEIMTNHKSADGRTGLGNHWTGSTDMAETAAMAGGVGGIPVRIKAGTRKADMDHVANKDASNNWSGEDETTFKQGAKFDIRDIEIKVGQRWESVWDAKGEGMGADAMDRYNNPDKYKKRT